MGADLEADQAVADRLLSNLRYSVRCPQNIAHLLGRATHFKNNDRLIGGQVRELFIEADSSGVNDNHPPTDGLYLGQNVRGQQDRVLFSKLSDEVQGFTNLQGIEPGGWLIQNQDRRVMHQGV